MTDIEYIHRFSEPVGGISLPGKFTFPFHYTPHPLSCLAAKEVQKYIRQKTEWLDELEQGKMFGVLVVRKTDGEVAFLAAFSGNLQKKSNHPYFVPPIYDLQRPDGFFIAEERAISRINQKIDEIQNSGSFSSAREELKLARENAHTRLSEEKQRMKRAKAERDRRKSSGATPEEVENMVRESQFQKAECKRLEKRLAEELSVLEEKCTSFERMVDELKNERKERSAALQMRLFDQFQIRNAQGEVKGLTEIFAPTPQGVPPAGAGECAAPKLLQYAYLHHLEPLAMAEFWWGQSPKAEIRHHLHYYPACKHKCEPILNFMLQGLDVEENPLSRDPFHDAESRIVYEDDYLVVVDKPAGMLSVPGKLGVTSVIDRLHSRHPDAIQPQAAHRLDMATSGLLLVAKAAGIQRDLHEQFRNHSVRKCYCAVLDGEVAPDKGIIDLPLLADFANRPRQSVSLRHGKRAITHFEVIGRSSGKTEVLFYPETGRTHQLRVHSAHADGLGAPICGDELYGRKSDRLYLHAQSLEFTHPVTHERIKLEVLPEWRKTL